MRRLRPMPASRIGITSALMLASALLGGCHSSPDSGGSGEKALAVQTKESQAAMTPQDALETLRAGNARFVAGQRQRRDLQAKVRATASGQYPFAVVLSCLDSRQPVELVFDQGIGD